VLCRGTLLQPASLRTCLSASSSTPRRWRARGSDELLCVCHDPCANCSGVGCRRLDGMREVALRQSESHVITLQCCDVVLDLTDGHRYPRAWRIVSVVEPAFVILECRVVVVEGGEVVIDRGALLCDTVLRLDLEFEPRNGRVELGDGRSAKLDWDNAAAGDRGVECEAVAGEGAKGGWLAVECKVGARSSFVFPFAFWGWPVGPPFAPCPRSCPGSRAPSLLVSGACGDTRRDRDAEAATHRGHGPSGAGQRASRTGAGPRKGGGGRAVTGGRKRVRARTTGKGSWPRTSSPVG